MRCKRLQVTGDKTLFSALYEKQFKNTIMERYGQNDGVFQTLFKDEEKLNFIKKMLLKELYNELRSAN